MLGDRRGLRERAALHEGDHFIGGKLYDAQGIEVPLQEDAAHAPRPRTAEATPATGRSEEKLPS